MRTSLSSAALVACAALGFALGCSRHEPIAWTGTGDADAKSDGTGVDSYEYIVVGSGAGGGPLASNLARAGHTVLLLEAGEDTGDRNTYRVPAFHTQSTEDPAMRWDYFVEHYSDP